MARERVDSTKQTDSGTSGDARQRVLDAAEVLFMQRGYAAITLRDIADALGIRQASLYYHFPDGKEQLYVEMAERLFARHRQGLEEWINAANHDVGEQLHAAAEWFATQPRMNLSSMMHADMPALEPESAARLGQVAYDALFIPLRMIFIDGVQRGETRPINATVMAGSFLAILDGLHFGERRADGPSRASMLNEIISVLLDGLRLSAGADSDGAGTAPDAAASA